MGRRVLFQEMWGSWRFLQGNASFTSSFDEGVASVRSAFDSRTQAARDCMGFGMSFIIGWYFSPMAWCHAGPWWSWWAMQVRKNESELAGMVAAHRRDGAAMCVALSELEFLMQSHQPVKRSCKHSKLFQSASWSSCTEDIARCWKLQGHTSCCFPLNWVHVDAYRGCFVLFTPLRVGWPPTPQVYFGPWEGLRVVFPRGGSPS